MTYGEWIEQEAYKKGRAEWEIEWIKRKLRRRKTPEWIHEEVEMPMDLILQVQEEISKENRG